MNYYISDLHLFHKNVTKAGRDFDNRPFADLEEMHAHILERWNNKVTDGDDVYILGDLAMRGTHEDLEGYVSKLKGRKILIKGNHDDLSDSRYRRLCDYVCDYNEVTDKIGGDSAKLVLSHYPILMWNGQRRGSILLYGHVHNSNDEFVFQESLAQFNKEVRENCSSGAPEMKAYNVGCMISYMDYEPRSLEEIVERSSVCAPAHR
jgi:calcineurin-like phosphoesterase family protein